MVRCLCHGEPEKGTVGAIPKGDGYRSGVWHSVKWQDVNSIAKHETLLARTEIQFYSL